MSKKRTTVSKKLYFQSAFWKAGVPFLIVVLTLTAGHFGHRFSQPQQPASARQTTGSANAPYLSGSMSNETLWEKTWGTVGHLLGETSFNQVDVSGTMAVRLIWLSRWLGLLLIAWAFIVIAWDEYRVCFKMTHLWAWRKLGKRHVIVYGAGAAGTELVKHLRAAKRRVVVVEKDEQCPNLTELRSIGAVVFLGDATSADMLSKSGAGHAEEVFVLCDNDEVNCRVVKAIERYLADKRGPCLQMEKRDGGEACHPCPRDCDRKFMVHVALESREYRSAMTDGCTSSPIAVHCFSFYDLAARALFFKSDWVPNWRNDGDHPRHIHTVVFGFTGQGQAIVLQSLRMLHLREDQERIVTIICRDAEQTRARFLAEYPCLGTPGDTKQSEEMKSACEGLFPKLEFVELPASTGGMRSPDFELYSHIKAGWRLNVFYCLDDGVLSRGLMDKLQGSLNWHKQQAGPSCDLFCACYRKYAEICVERGHAEQVYYGEMTELCTREMIAAPETDRIAKEIMMFYDTTFGDEKTSAKATAAYACYVNRKWAFSQEWERESNAQAADHIRIKLALIGLTASSPDSPTLKALLETEGAQALNLLARVEHRRWCAERLLGGWLPLSHSQDADHAFWFSKDPADRARVKRYKNELKHHYDLRPFDDLPEAEKTKDYEMIRKIPELIARKKSPA